MNNSLIKRINKMSELGILLVLVLLCTVVSLVNPTFYSFDNIMNILRTTSYVIIAALAATMVFITGGLDLSVGSIIGLGGLISGVCLAYFKLPVWVSIVAGLMLGVIFGLFNGLAIVKGKIPPLIVTLGTLYMARGLMNVITKGKPVYPLPESFNIIGSGTLLGVPYSVILVAVMAIIVHLILKYTIYGRYIYAIGGNEETSRLSGIDVELVKISVYIISAVCAALSGIVMSARMASAQVSTGTGWEMTVIASVIIGGTSMFGGSGTVLGTVIGALLMTTLTNGMVLMRVSAYWQNVAIGAIIIIAVAIDQYKRRKSGDIV